MNLHAVRELKERIVTSEAELLNLRGLAQNLVPTLDGMPRATTLESRVEKLALKISGNSLDLALCDLLVVPSNSAPDQLQFAASVSAE